MKHLLYSQWNGQTKKMFWWCIIVFMILGTIPLYQCFEHPISALFRVFGYYDISTYITVPDYRGLLLWGHWLFWLGWSATAIFYYKIKHKKKLASDKDPWAKWIKRCWWFGVVFGGIALFLSDLKKYEDWQKYTPGFDLKQAGDHWLTMIVLLIMMEIVISGLVYLWFCQVIRNDNQYKSIYDESSIESDRSAISVMNKILAFIFGMTFIIQAGRWQMKYIRDTEEWDVRKAELIREADEKEAARMIRLQKEREERHIRDSLQAIEDADMERIRHQKLMREMEEFKKSYKPSRRSSSSSSSEERKHPGTPPDDGLFGWDPWDDEDNVYDLDRWIIEYDPNYYW